MKKVFLLLGVLFVTATYAQTAADYVRKAADKANRKDFAGAIALFDKAIELEPKEYSHYLNRAYCEFNMGDTEQAKYDVDDVRSIFPNDPVIHIATTHFFVEIMDFDHVVEVNEGILKKFPNLHDSLKLNIYINTSMAKHSMNDAAGAKVELDKAYKLDSLNTGVLINLAGAYDDLGSPEESVRLLKKVLVLEPDNIAIYNNLGFIYSNMGKHSESIDVFNKSIDLLKNSKDDESKKALGFTYSNRGFAKSKLEDYKGALKDYEKSIELAPTNSYVYKNRAVTYIAMRKFKEACVDLNTATMMGFSDMYGDEVDKLSKLYCK